MHYWKALAFLRSRVLINQPTQLSLTEITEALGCTKRNAQLIIKKLVNEGWIDWKSGVGRGNLPTLTLLKNVNHELELRIDELLSENKVDQALELIEESQRDLFLLGYISRYQSLPTTLDILQIPFYRGTHSLDPIEVTRRTEAHITRYLFSNLLRFNTRTHSFEGDLAIDWSQDENRWYFTLRKGLVFHDGSSILAQDIKAHFLRLIGSSHHNSQQFKCISTITVIDPLHLCFAINANAGYLPSLLSSSAAGIAKKVGEQIIGSGSFKLVEQSEWLTRLEAFKAYYGHRPWVDGIEIWNVGDKAKDYEMHCDIVHSYPHYQQSLLQNELAEIEQWEKGCEYALLNSHRHPWLAEPQHLRSLNDLLRLLGVAKDIPLNTVGYAYGMLSTSSQPSKSKLVTANDKDALKVARQFADKLNKPKQPIKILTYQLFDHIKMARHYCEQLNELGFSCEYQVLEFPDFCQQSNLQNADILISGEVFSDNLDSSWMGWLQSSIALEVCLTDEQKQWRNKSLEQLWVLNDYHQRQSAFLELEAQLIEFGVYRPIFHVKQQLNYAKTVNPVEQLANGWIDFNQITMRR
ncbi:MULTISPECIES: ABC transporter substrate-binding protein [Vibrio]|uniref:ABC transporter substrate-binding protein n=2 Tax=Vibrionaceae TaxID=641 RepID=UPI0002FB391A|nr:ABC transporter substrate-binding protein [Vibrio tasmaniensis]OEF69496.1 ABC transporter substrate-binding protein [Vibrio tasmaniensis 1F-155]PMO82974.1 ABC transporter substrate-binding protein [Vibrio tasmaniensis]